VKPCESMYSIVEQNLRTAMRSYAFIGEGGEAREYTGVAIASSGLNVPVFNSAMLLGPAGNMEKLIATADVHFRARKLGWTFWVCEDLLAPDRRDAVLERVFQSKGMRRIADPPGMYADRIVPPVRPAAPLTFAQVDSEHTRLEFAHIASTVFSLPFVTAKRIYGATGLWRPPSYGWIGYFEGKPVSVVTTVTADEAIGVYSLGTLPQHQGCGFGETLLRHALGEANRRTGIERSVLQATAQGLNLYRRMGYRFASKFSIYMREG
jgi:ribosomal protein S18 acetylase RimI-like enzyme